LLQPLARKPSDRVVFRRVAEENVAPAHGNPAQTVSSGSMTPEPKLNDVGSQEHFTTRLIFR
jgi:hypothetical protein